MIQYDHTDLCQVHVFDSEDKKLNGTTYRPKSFYDQESISFFILNGLNDLRVNFVINVKKLILHISLFRKFRNCYTESKSWNFFQFPTRSSHWRFSIEKGVLKILAKFKGKHLYQGFFFNKVRPPTLFKNRLWHRCFPVNFAKFLRHLFLQNNYGWLRIFLPIIGA